MQGLFFFYDVLDLSFVDFQSSKLNYEPFEFPSEVILVYVMKFQPSHLAHSISTLGEPL